MASLRNAVEDYRATLATAPDTDAASFARRTRNSVARAVIAASLSPEREAGPPAHPAPFNEVRAHVGPELAMELVALHDGGPDWPSRAIAVLEPLHLLARRN